MRTCLCLICLMLSLASVHAQTCTPDTIQASTPDSQLTDNGDGTIGDLKTGLIWKKCVEGFSGSACDTGSPATFNWQQALEHPGDINSGTGFAGYYDWRLPNIKELASIIEEQCSEPSINQNRFPNSENSLGNYFWTGSPHAFFTERAWQVNFATGSSTYTTRINVSYVRLVRSGQ